MTLSATEYTRLRRLTGGVVTSTDDDYLTDAELQAEYDAAGGWDLAVVYVLRIRVAMCSPLFNVSREQNSESRVQKREALEKLLARAEELAGVAGGTLTAGVLDYNIDTDYEDTDSV